MRWYETKQIKKRRLNMKQRYSCALVFLYVILFSVRSYSQAIPKDSLYLGQTPPGDTPKIFIPSASGRIAVSPDGKEIYYRSVVAGINFFRYSNNKWNGPVAVFNNYCAPTFSIDGNTLYFHLLGDYNYDIWNSSRNDTDWNSPSLYGKGLYYFQETNSGNKYVGLNNSAGGIGNYDICQMIGTTFKNLGVPLNTTNNDAEFFIAKDESFIVLGANEGGPGGRDLYISYRKSDSTWTSPKSLGTLINDGDYYKWGPFVTADNKYLFYAKATSPYNIYWVRFDRLLDSLRYTNFPPYAKSSIASQAAIKDSLFDFTVPDSTFYDEDHDPLTYSAALNNGNPLPSWLSFDSLTRTFSGTPLTARAIPLYIKVMATDPAHTSASCVFNLIVKKPLTGVEEDNGHLPKESELLQNYPNPFNPTTVISYQLSVTSNVKLMVYNVLGQKIKTLVNSFQNSGEHSVVWYAMDDRSNPVSSGIYFYTLQTNGLNYQKKMVLIR
jgi:hypothetical protein